MIVKAARQMLRVFSGKAGLKAVISTWVPSSLDARRRARCVNKLYDGDLHDIEWSPSDVVSMPDGATTVRACNVHANFRKVQKSWCTVGLRVLDTILDLLFDLAEASVVAATSSDLSSSSEPTALYLQNIPLRQTFLSPDFSCRLGKLNWSIFSSKSATKMQSSLDHETSLRARLCLLEQMGDLAKTKVERANAFQDLAVVTWLSQLPGERFGAGGIDAKTIMFSEEAEELLLEKGVTRGRQKALI